MNNFKRHGHPLMNHHQSAQSLPPNQPLNQHQPFAPQQHPLNQPPFRPQPPFNPPPSFGPRFDQRFPTSQNIHSTPRWFPPPSVQHDRILFENKITTERFQMFSDIRHPSNSFHPCPQSMSDSNNIRPMPPNKLSIRKDDHVSTRFSLQTTMNPQMLSNHHSQPRMHQHIQPSRLFTPNRMQSSVQHQIDFPSPTFAHPRPSFHNPGSHIWSEQVSGGQVKPEEYKDAMKELVETWLKSRNISKRANLEYNFLKLHDYKEKTKDYLLKLEELRVLNDKLVEHMEVDNDAWSELINNANALKNDVLGRQYQLFNVDQVEYISKQMKQRKKKRDRIKRKKKKDTDQYHASLSNRIKLNETIDEWQHKEQRKILLEKIDENLKNEAGESLVVVKRKQTEANEYINIFHNLKQLRDVRKKTAIFKGIFVTENDNTTFDLKIDGVIKLLSDQKKVYEDEERALRVLREEEAEEFNRVENERRKKRKQSRQQDLNLVDPMFTYRLYWLQAEDNTNNFIHIRGLWDMYLCQANCPDGTRIPKCWVEPGLPSNRQWDKFLVYKKTNIRKRKSDINKQTVVYG